MPCLFPRPCRAVLFDLDGTLVDSRLDIANSLNRALAGAGMPQLSADRVADFVGDGVRKLTQRALREVSGREPGRAETDALIAAYLEDYREHLLDDTRLCDGVLEVLERMHWVRFGVVTNKPEGFSRSILEGLGIGDRFSVIFGGDSLPKRKPDPEPLRIAMQRCGADATETVMVGDSPVDILAGKAAGTMTCAVTGGFRSRSDLDAAGADLLVESLQELPAFFHPPAPSAED